jgi:hypothetical protein
MTMLPNYSFLPFLRQGVANTITSADGDQTVATRASTYVQLQLSGDPVGGGPELKQALAQDVALYGPGDVIGIDRRAVVRTEPRDWITNFEGNYLAAVDFYDEDFPWRYTPAAPGGGHLQLRPWITLIVLAEGEFDEGKDMSGRPLPYVTLHDGSVLPPADDLWAWAHVHFNQSLSASQDEIVSTDTAAVVARAQSILAANRDLGYSRLLCPRRLQDSTTYHALVIPTFETGRLAGVGLDPATAPYATHSAWAGYANRPKDLEHPVYYRWQFTTGTVGDFEYLVRLLVPQPVDPRVGTRDMDVQNPGSNLPGTAAALGGVLRLGGALQVPIADLDEQQQEERAKFENWDQPYPNPFEQDLAAFVNLADDYAAQSPGAANAASGLPAGIGDDPDPLITAPLYGRWHALTQRLLSQRDGTPAPDTANWVHRLNLDPRFRVPAGFDAGVVEANAEDYMNDAWQQIGDVLAANTRIRGMQLGVAVAARWFDRHLTPLAAVAPERALALTGPVQARIIQAGQTVASLRSASLAPPALTSTAMRRVLRPGSRLMRTLPFTGAVAPGTLLQRINTGAVVTAPPKITPQGVVTVGQVAAAAQPPGGPGSLLGRLARIVWQPWALLLLGVVALVILTLVLPLGAGLTIGLLLLAALAALAWLLWRDRQQEQAEASIAEEDQNAAAVPGFPANPAFTLSVPGSGMVSPTGATDSPVAVRFKQALGDSFALIQASTIVGSTTAPATLDLPTLTTATVAAVNPTVTIPARVFSTIALPAWISGQLVDQFEPVMAYPKIDVPMYGPLKDISVELFLPNINLIAPNSITLIETNQRFIESYMVGLNYEFGRKLLWREYPTDLRGSYFRQFWDVRSVINNEGLSESSFTEQLYDIPELHRWPLTSALGDHNNRQSAGEQGEQAVLVIRGELLKKYPTAIIYAHRAQWEYEADGTTPDLTKPRTLVPLTDAEEQQPPPAKMRFPLYEAKADPDIYFFGFDLTIEEVLGGTGVPPDVDPGWFFVIKERPGEPRFGLELSSSGPPQVLDEVTWDDAVGPVVAGGPPQFLPAASLDPVTLAPLPAGDPEGKGDQQKDDQQADAAAVSAARWAYVLFRPPVMVAIHARQMLRGL